MYVRNYREKIISTCFHLNEFKMIASPEYYIFMRIYADVYDSSKDNFVLPGFVLHFLQL